MCFLEFDIPWVNAEFCISFFYDFTFWLHFSWGIILTYALMYIFCPADAVVSSILFNLGYEVAKGTCSAQGMNLLDLSGSIFGIMIVFLIIIELKKRLYG